MARKICKGNKLSKIILKQKHILFTKNRSNLREENYCKENKQAICTIRLAELTLRCRGNVTKVTM